MYRLRIVLASRAITDDLRRNEPHFLSLSLFLSAISTRYNDIQRTPHRDVHWYTVFQRRETTNDSDRNDNVSRTTARFPQIPRLLYLPFSHPRLGSI